MSSPYAFRPGGALKLKSSGDEGKKKKKKTKSSTTASVQFGASSSRAAPAEPEGKPAEAKPGEEFRPAPSAGGATKAERHFHEVQRKRMAEQVRKEARKSHKERVNSFNAYLESLTDHNDMPKIGPG